MPLWVHCYSTIDVYKQFLILSNKKNDHFHPIHNTPLHFFLNFLILSWYPSLVMARNTHQNAIAANQSNQGASSNSTMQIQNQLQMDLAQNPYFLHSSESPNQILVSPIFTGSNYHSWARSMKRALISKNKYKFVNGTISKPEEFDPMYDAWERCNNMVHNWLIHSISPAIARSVDALELASDVWRDLRERFSRATWSKLQS